MRVIVGCVPQTGHFLPLLPLAQAFNARGDEVIIASGPDAAGEIALSVPERHYDLAAQLLARAVEYAADGSVPVVEALRSVAREHGRSVGARLHPLEGRSRRQLIEQLAELLTDQGYEPHVEDTAITLRNCPFHALTTEHRELVCGMNLELIKGVVETGGLPDTAARLDPAPGRCCVSLLA